MTRKGSIDRKVDPAHFIRLKDAFSKSFDEKIQVTEDKIARK